MAKTTSCLGIEYVGNEARLALVEQGEQGLSLAATRTVAAGEDLGRVLRSMHRRPSSTACAVSLDMAAVRILTLPATSEDNLERVVALEAEGALPLGSDELALSHHMLGMTDQSRLEVLVAAARLSTVQETIRQVSSLPGGSPTVTVTSIALLNALQHLRGAAREPVCAVLRVEEAGSELLVLDRMRPIVARLIPIGCAAGVRVEEPVAVGAGAAAPEPSGAESAWIAALSQQVRYALQAVSYERGLSSERLYLCGKGAAAADLAWSLGERLDLPVTPLSPEADGSPEGSPYAVAFGCAVQAAGLAPVPLNLTPARVTVAREVEQRRQSRISWGALAASLVIAGGLVFAAAVQQKKRAIAEMDRRLSQVQVSVQAPQVAPAQLQSGEKAVAAALETRVSAARAVSTLGRLLPPGTWLAELAYNSDTGCVVRGYSMTQSGPQQALVALIRQQELFDDVTLDYRTEERLNNVPVWGFQLTCKLQPKERQGRRGARRR